MRYARRNRSKKRASAGAARRREKLFFVRFAESGDASGLQFAILAGELRQGEIDFVCFAAAVFAQVVDRFERFVRRSLQFFYPAVQLVEFGGDVSVQQEGPGISTPNEPNISSTRWRTVSDQKNLTYFFESTLYPNVFWVDFRDVDFAPGAPVKMLDLVSGKTYAGNAAERFRDAAPFEFQGIG